MKMITKRVWLTSYAIGMSLFVLSAILPCTSGCTGWKAGLWSLMFAFLFPFHSLAILVVLLSPLALRRIIRGRARAVWIVLLICMPALWLSPAAVTFPSVRPGYFVWVLAVSLVTLSLIMLSHIESPIQARRSQSVFCGAIVLALTYFVNHPYCVHPRFWQLQLAGRLPDGAKYPSDQLMAEQTYWWGRRLDPKQFWADKVVWDDDVSQAEAARRGRGYPPMPYDDPSVHDRSDRSTHGDGIGGPDSGPSIRYLSSERERAFWDKFTKTHPLPPADIEREQRRYGQSMMREEYILAHDLAYASRLRLKPDSPQKTIDSARYHLRGSGFPAEALTSNALFWAYVHEQREEYNRMLSARSNALRSNETELQRRNVDKATIDNMSNYINKSYGTSTSNFLGRLYVEKSLVSEPLTDEQKRQADAWKVEYLRRLRREHADNMYIRAYVDAWALDASQIMEQ